MTETTKPVNVLVTIPPDTRPVTIPVLPAHMDSFRRVAEKFGWLIHSTSPA